MTWSKRLTHGTTPLVAGFALIVAGLAGLALLMATARWTGWLDRPGEDPAVRNGRWIYFTGTSRDGRRIPYSGGMMMRLSCAQCHGADGRGRRTPMFVSPDITYRNLTDPAGMLEPDGERGPVYTDELIRRAVTRGIGADGEPLAWPMPRWQLTEEEWNALLAFLKQLP